MWADMVADAKQQAEQENTSQQEELEALAIPAPAVVEMIQRTLVLMGSIHANINQRRRVSILEAIDKDFFFDSYATAEANISQGKLLFGQDFTEALQDSEGEGKFLSPEDCRNAATGQATNSLTALYKG